VDDQLHVVHEEAILFDGDDDLRHYNVKKGVLTNPHENEVFAPVPMWIEALDLVLSRMSEKGVDLTRVKGISGAGQQHGSV
jgi:xylulokinase